MSEKGRRADILTKNSRYDQELVLDMERTLEVEGREHGAQDLHVRQQMPR